MYKIGLSLLVLISVYSCKRNYSCQCTFKADKTSIPLGEISKKEATTTCASINKAWSDSDGSCILSK